MNLKQPALIFLGGMLCLNASAVPAKPGLRTFTQPDGTTVTVRLVGDESFHTQITADGIAVQRQADGFFYYRDAEGVTSVKAHDVEQRDAVEKAFLAARSADMPMPLKAPARHAVHSPRPARHLRYPTQARPACPCCWFSTATTNSRMPTPRPLSISFSARVIPAHTSIL